MSIKENLDDLITENKENAEELSVVDKKSALNKDEMGKKIAKLILANKENAIELSAAYKIISTQKKGIKKQAADLIRADKEKEKRKADLLSAKKELMLAAEKAKLVLELTLLNKELTIQIAERKQTEEALWQSKRELSTLMDNLPGMVYSCLNDQDWTMKFVSEGSFDLTGYLPDELTGNKIISYKEIIHPDDREMVSVTIRDALEKKSAFTLEYRIVMKCGTVKHVWERGQGVVISNDTLHHLEGYITDITGHKLAEDKLKESEKLFHHLFFASPDAIMLLDPTDPLGGWPIVNCNEVACTMNGYKREELIGKSIDMLNISAGTPEERAEYLESLRRKSIIRMETFHRHRDGHIFPIEVSTSIINFGDRELILGIDRDITERKRAEDQLRSSEERFKVIFDYAPDAYYLNDLKGNLIEGNIAAEKMLGYDKNELIGKNFLKLHLLSPNQLLKAAKLLAKNFLGKATGPDEFVINRKDGSKVNVEISTHPVKIQEQKVVLGIARDITKRKRAEEALLENEAKYRTLVTQSPDGIFIVDLSGTFLSVNKSMCENLKYSEEEMLSMKLWDIVPPEYLSLHKSRLADIIRGERKNEAAEYEVKGKDGIGHTIEVLSAPYYKDKVIIGFQGIARDITKRKRTEKELIEAKEHAEESDRLKSAFLANMSHEIRTPMNGILGFSALLSEPGLESEEQQEYIEIIQKSGARMLNILTEIIDISKIESGLIEFRFKEVNINKQVESVYKLLKPDAEVKAINFLIKNSLPMDEAIIQTDGEKLYGILSNLVKNAIKYTDKGSIEFGYEIAETHGPRNIGAGSASLQFYVKDTGIGIPKDRQEAIFERFIQADIADVEARQGAGLGLSIAKAYVEMLGGKIWLESEKGKGSIFYFTIPYNSEPGEKSVAAKIIPAENTENQIIPEISGLKILIAEDDDVSEMLITINVNEFGKEILNARTGVEAIEICRQNPDIDLILMDIQMPVMNGYKATQQIRQFNKDVIIIAQTAFGLEGDREKSIEAGCNDYISKPINSIEFKSLINKYFNKEHKKDNLEIIHSV